MVPRKLIYALNPARASVAQRFAGNKTGNQRPYQNPVPIVNRSCRGTLVSVISISCRIHTTRGPLPVTYAYINHVGYPILH